MGIKYPIVTIVMGFVYLGMYTHISGPFVRRHKHWN